MGNELFKPFNHMAEGTLKGVQQTRTVYDHGSDGVPPSFYRYVVLETIFDPALVDAEKIVYYEHSLRVSNIHLARVLPRNTIVAQRVMTPGTSATTPAMFLFPFFPPSLSLPCQPGEHVWVMFEDPTGKRNDLGFWFCRIVEPGFVEDVNHTHSPRALDPGFSPGTKDSFDGSNKPTYEFRNGQADDRGDGRYTVASTQTLAGDENAYERLLVEPEAAKLQQLEPVPRFKKRPGDVALEGSNNSLIVLGRDRNGAACSFRPASSDGRSTIVDGIPANDSHGPSTGMIDIVVGRGQTSATSGQVVSSKDIKGNDTGFQEVAKSSGELSPGEGDPDFANDRSRVYVAQRTRVSSNFSLQGVDREVSKGSIQGGAPNDLDRSKVSDTERGDGGIVIKSDKLRLIARSDIEILVTGHLGRDQAGNLVASNNDADFAVLAIKSNGDIVLRPSRLGFIKLGGDDAVRPVLCGDVPAVPVNGVVTGAPLTTTMGGLFAGAKPAGENDNGPMLSSGQGVFSAKVLIK